MKITYAFIDASNLFYGGVKSLGWKIDYQKLLDYLKQKYKISKAFYYAGIEIYDFSYSVLDDKPIDLEKFLEFLKNKLKKENKRLSEAQIILLKKNIQRAKFYLKLKNFGYILRLKPVKIYKGLNKITKRKANCDVDMTFDVFQSINKFDKAVILSGDGDFVILLKYLMEIKKEIIVLARGERTAKEIKQLIKGDFKDFNYLKYILEFE